jgi:hypothetical protein
MALMWLITSEPPLYLLYYILTEGAVTFLLYGTLIFHDESTYEYAHIWGLCTLLLASAYFTLSYYFLTKNPKKAIAVVCALLVSFSSAFLTYRHLLRHNLAAWLGVGAGAILVGSGVVLYVSAPYHVGKDKIIALVLGPVLSLKACGILGLCCTRARGGTVRTMLPTMMCFVFWSYLGMRLRQGDRTLTDQRQAF